MLSSLLYKSFQVSGLTALARSLRDGGVVFCYHNVVADDARGGDPAIHLGISAFTRQTEWIRMHYDVLPLSEIAARLSERRILRRTAAITFDDAYAGVFTNALPVLARHALPATIFVPTTCIDRAQPFWWDHPAVVARLTGARRVHWLHELRGDAAAILANEGASIPAALPTSHLPAPWWVIVKAQREGWTLGAHSATHRSLPRLDDGDLTMEIEGSRDALEAKAAVRPELFAYPYGAWDRRVADRVKAAGFSAAVTLDAGFNTHGLDAMSMRRINVPALIPDAAFQAWAAGLQPSRA